jgi:LuxR family maltose regulon positive regulatory protein
VAATPDLCLARAWIALDLGRPAEAERWLEGATQDGSTESAVLHAVLCFKLGKLEHAERIAREARALAAQDAPLGLTVASCILGITLYYRGELVAARDALEEARGLAVGGGNTLAAVYALGYEASLAVENGDREGARLLVDEAFELASAPATAEHFVTGMAWLPRGRIDADEAALESALGLARRGAAPLEIAAVLLALGELRRDPATLRAARSELESCEDPGRLPALIEAAELELRGRRSGPRRQIAGDLSDRELAVLRLMSGEASLREIAGTLYLSLNTVKTHTRSIYRKLGASSREEAVERGRELGLV